MAGDNFLVRPSETYVTKSGCSGPAGQRPSAQPWAQAPGRVEVVLGDGGGGARPTRNTPKVEGVPARWRPRFPGPPPRGAGDEMRVTRRRIGPAGGPEGRPAVTRGRPVIPGGMRGVVLTPRPVAFPSGNPGPRTGSWRPPAAAAGGVPPWRRKAALPSSGRRGPSGTRSGRRLPEPPARHPPGAPIPASLPAPRLPPCPSQNSDVRPKRRSLRGFPALSGPANFPAWRTQVPQATQKATFPTRILSDNSPAPPGPAEPGGKSGWAEAARRKFCLRCGSRAVSRRPAAAAASRRKTAAFLPGIPTAIELKQRLSSTQSKISLPASLKDGYFTRYRSAILNSVKYSGILQKRIWEISVQGNC